MFSTQRFRVLAFSLYGPLAASHRVRLSQFQSGLACAGIDLTIQSLLDDNYLRRRFAGRPLSFVSLIAAYVNRIQSLRNLEHFDLVIVYGELLPFVPGWLERRMLRIPFIYDFDDAFFLKYKFGSARLLHPLLGCKTDRLIRNAVSITAGNSYLAAYARSLNPSVTVLPSVVDTDYYCPSQEQSLPNATTPFTVGWIGSPSTSVYLSLLIQPLQLFAREHPVRLLVVGGVALVIPGVEVINHEWSVADELLYIRQFHVGVMPLPDTQWTRGKCSYKLIQCMACGVPVVASSVGANLDAVPAECGFLAETPEEWLFAFQFLATDAEKRRTMGLSARRWVEQRYSLRYALPVLQEVLKSSLSRSRC